MRMTARLPDHSAVVEALLEGFVRACQVCIEAGLAPLDPMDSNVRYQLEASGAEEWKLPQYCVRDGWGDCEDLAGWRAAGLRISGEDPGARVIVTETGKNRLHAVVERSDGTIDDPSREKKRTAIMGGTRTGTRTEVRSPTSTSTDAYTRGNVTVTGGAGSGRTSVSIYRPMGALPGGLVAKLTARAAKKAATSWGGGGGGARAPEPAPGERPHDPRPWDEIPAGQHSKTGVTKVTRSGTPREATEDPYALPGYPAGYPPPGTMYPGMYPGGTYQGGYPPSGSSFGSGYPEQQYGGDVPYGYGYGYDAYTPYPGFDPGGFGEEGINPYGGFDPFTGVDPWADGSGDQ